MKPKALIMSELEVDMLTQYEYDTAIFELQCAYSSDDAEYIAFEATEKEICEMLRQQYGSMTEFRLAIN